MGFFSRLFRGAGPSREDWGVISLRIAKGLEEVRKKWFETLVGIFREMSKKGAWKDPPITVKRTNLAGDATHALKAYQLYLVSAFLAKHGYIPPSQGRDFADLLFAQVCGTELEQCLAFFNRYHEAHEDPGRQLFRFASDISRYITGNDTSFYESMLVDPTIPVFAWLTHMVVADAFGDQVTVAQLQTKLSEFRAKLSAGTYPFSGGSST